MSPSISVIVTTYERPEALDAVLRGLSRQSDRDFEIVVADDGSGPTTAALIEGWRQRLGVPLSHAWQPDEGFRPAESRNRGLRASKGAYVVFLDGDCIPFSDFVARHRALAEPGSFVFGNRMLLSQAATQDALHDGVEVETYGWSHWLMERLRGRINRLLPLARLPDGAWRHLHAGEWRGVRSANMAAWRADLEAIDGFDAEFTGWGLEDSDIAIRLIRSGVRRKDGRFATGVLHLWHKEADRAGLAANERRLADIQHGVRLRAQRGLSTLDVEKVPIP
jgi:glycosyltransferase involved in cell wall biosynthesis